MTIPLQEGLIYGPVDSRRLGRSLGINPLPLTMKVCSMDCPYCQYGWTQSFHGNTKRPDLPTVEDVLGAAEKAVRAMVAADDAPDAVTVAGNGEPTLHPEFARITAGLRTLLDEHAPAAKLCLLSDGLHLRGAGMAEAMGLYDLPLLKLEWGSPACFAALTGLPASRLERLLEDLESQERWVAQTMFVDPPDGMPERGNTSDAEIEAWIGHVARTQPEWVEIYSLDRPPADEALGTVSAERLSAIAKRLEAATGIRGDVHAREGATPGRWGAREPAATS